MDGRLIYMCHTGPRCTIQKASSPRNQGDSKIRYRSYGAYTNTLTHRQPSFIPFLFTHSPAIIHLTNISQGTIDVRLDPQLNKKVWESGIKGVPYRLRVRISRKRNDEEGAKEKLYSYVQAVNVKEREAKGLTTVVVEDS